ncbi:MAG: hypothetical protein HQM00_12690 [Magnetococcales bacterium]|nr:hypothetical protein [Magnetococcales bacterium]
MGISVLILDLMIGMIFLVIILTSALPLTTTPEPTEADARRLKALNNALTAQLLVREGRLQGLLQHDTPATLRPEDLESVAIPSPGARQTGVALLQSEVADLTARNAALIKRLKSTGSPPAPVQDEATQAGQSARIERLQTEIARLNTRIDEAIDETGAARRKRIELEAKLLERESRITQLGHEVHALASRAGVPLPAETPPPRDLRTEMNPATRAPDPDHAGPNPETLDALMTRLEKRVAPPLPSPPVRPDLTAERSGSSQPTSRPRPTNP